MTIPLGKVSNEDAYEAPDVVSYYSELKGLQAPEETIFTLLRGYLSGKKVLDIGVGGGRTTEALVGMAGQYEGIDSSEVMIAVCKQKYNAYADKCAFSVCDVRSMTQYGDSTFDFVLFSFNGLGALSVSDRIHALKEIKRVGKAGGYYCFSSHNLQCVPKQFVPKVCANPIKLGWRVSRWLYLLARNKGFIGMRDKQYAIINDGGHDYRITSYYIKPAEQLRQLYRLGFSNVRIFLGDGSEVENLSNLSDVKDWWLYYLCQM